MLLIFGIIPNILFLSFERTQKSRGWVGGGTRLGCTPDVDHAHIAMFSAFTVKKT
jgi:hypothetical protein